MEKQMHSCWPMHGFHSKESAEFRIDRSSRLCYTKGAGFKHFCDDFLRSVFNLWRNIILFEVDTFQKEIKYQLIRIIFGFTY